MINQIQRLLKEVNKECFNNELVLNFPVKLSNSASAAGDVLVDRRTSTVLRFRISKNYAWTEELLKNVIAHELIHVYEAQILKARPDHGYNFLKKMNEINKLPGYKVEVRHRMPSTKAKRAKKALYILSEEKTRVCFLHQSKSTLDYILPETLERIFGKNYKVGMLTSDKLAGYTVSRKLRHTYRVTPEKLKALGIE